jgi:guanylate kinase
VDKQQFLNEFSALVPTYRPAPDVAQKISQVSLFMVIGPSGSGKTTLLKGLGLPYVPSDVTRPKRPEEIEGYDYTFRTDYDKILADIKAGRFVQIAISPDGEFYATSEDVYPSSGWASVAIVADAVPRIREIGFHETLSVFITPPSYEIWLTRMDRHNLDEERLKKRLAEAHRSYNFALNDAETHFILSDEIGPTLTQSKGLIAGRVDKVRDEQARQAAVTILQKLAQTSAE